MSSDIIDFDGHLFFNRQGLNKIGLSPTDSDAIYTYLLTQHKMNDGIAGYIFINSTINVRLKRWYFERVKLLTPEPLTASRLYELCREFIREFIGNYTYHPFKLCGFFEVGKRQQIGNHHFFELHPINTAYAASCRIEKPFSFDVSEDDLTHEQTTGITFLRKPTLSDSENLKRIEAELFFLESDLVEAVTYQVTCFDPAKVGPFPVRTFKKGEEIPIISPLEKPPVESPLVIANHERIIAALFWILQNETRPKFNNKTSIYNHLELHFKGITGLNGHYIKEFIKTASEELQEREEENRFSETYLEKITK